MPGRDPDLVLEELIPVEAMNTSDYIIINQEGEGIALVPLRKVGNFIWVLEEE